MNQRNSSEDTVTAHHGLQPADVGTAATVIEQYSSRETYTHRYSYDSCQTIYK
jgi:hypothetical protein